MLLIAIIIPVVGFDVLESFLDWELLNEIYTIFDFEEHELVGERIFSQIVDIGYESFNSIMLLNTIGIVLIIYLIKVFIWTALKVPAFLSKNEKLNKSMESQAKNMFFGELFNLYI